MSDPVIIAGALVTVIAAITSAIVTVINAQALNKKADSLLGKTDVIHDLTNSNLKDITTKLEAALVKIISLEGLVVTLSNPKSPARKK